MATRVLQMPSSRQHTTLLTHPGDRLVFAFSPAQVFAERTGQDLVLARHDGSRLTLKDFYTHPEALLPEIEINGKVTPGGAFLDGLNQEDMPQAGHIPEVVAARFHEYSDDALLQGVDALGPLGAKHDSTKEELRLREPNEN
ncbi:MAG: hypothetical protein RR317_05025, partial [Bilophila sp.]